MPGKSLSELSGMDTEVESTETDLQSLPEEKESGGAPPYPGNYLFSNPKDMSSLYDVFEAKDKDGTVLGTRVAINFDSENPLIIEKAFEESGKEFEGNPLAYVKFSNKKRNRPGGVYASDWDYFLKALGVTDTPKKNEDYVKLTIKNGPGKKWVGTIEWTGYCNEKKQAYYQDQTDGSVHAWTEPSERDPNVMVERKGCGKRIYQSAWTKVDGKFAPRMNCPNPNCGASIRPFPQVVKPRSVASMNKK